MTCWPFAYGLWFVVVLSARSNSSADLPVPSYVLIALHAATAAVLLALYVVYLRHAYANPALGAARQRWVRLILYAGVFIMPLYWIRYIWPEGNSPRRMT